MTILSSAKNSPPTSPPTETLEGRILSGVPSYTSQSCLPTSHTLSDNPTKRRVSTSQITFFPPYDSHSCIPSFISQHRVKMTSKGPVVAPSEPWARPTACDDPNPPRKRTIPIRFASNAFDPRGWSPPASRQSSSVQVPTLASIEQELVGAPAIIHAQIAHPGRTLKAEKRVEAIGFATTSFGPDGWESPLVTSDSTSTLGSSPHDEILMSPSDSFELPKRPAGAFRRRTEPIGFAANSWQIGMPQTPIQVDTRVVSPTESPSNVFDWEPVYIKVRPKKSEPKKPCTKWMTRSDTPPEIKSPNDSPPATDEEISSHCHKCSPEGLRFDLLKVERGSHRRTDSDDAKSDTTIRPSQSIIVNDRQDTSSIQRQVSGLDLDAVSPRLTAQEQIAHEDAMDTDGLDLVELDIRTLHPKLTRLPSFSPTPEPRKAGAEGAIGLGLYVDYSDPSFTPPRSAPGSAKDKLTEVWGKHIEAIGPQSYFNARNLTPKVKSKTPERLVTGGDLEDVFQTPTKGANPIKTSPNSQGSAQSFLRKTLEISPTVPPSSPSDEAFPTLSPLVDAKDDPFCDWTERRKVFDVDAVSAKLSKFRSRISFTHLEGLEMIHHDDDGLDEEEDVCVSNHTNDKVSVRDEGHVSLIVGRKRSFDI